MRTGLIQIVDRFVKPGAISRRSPGKASRAALSGGPAGGIACRRLTEASAGRPRGHGLRRQRDERLAASNGPEFSSKRCISPDSMSGAELISPHDSRLDIGLSTFSARSSSRNRQPGSPLEVTRPHPHRARLRGRAAPDAQATPRSRTGEAVSGRSPGKRSSETAYALLGSPSSGASSRARRSWWCAAISRRAKPGDSIASLCPA